MKKKLGYLVLTLCFFALMFVFTSCGGGGSDTTTSNTTKNTSSTTTQTPENEKGVFTVTFDSNGGSQVDSQTIKEGNKVEEPNTPTKSGYSFTGWYYKDAKWDFANSTVTDNMILKARWDIVTYTLTLINNQTEAGTISNGGSYTYNETITIKATRIFPYKFDGWYEGTTKVSGNDEYTFKMPAKNVTYEAKFVEDADTPYVIEHYKQNLANDDYTLAYTENLKGVATKQTAAVAKEYEGFSAPAEIKQKTITGDGLTVVKIYYTRNSYTIELASDTEKGTVSGANTYKYEENVTITATKNVPYKFDGWYDGEKLVSTDAEYKFKMPAKNVSYEAKFSEDSSTPYTVEHYQQNIYDDNYTLVYTDKLTGVATKQTAAVAKEYEGFTSPTEVTQAVISADGTTVVKIYYTRNSYDITLSTNTNDVTVNGTGTYKYGEEVTISISNDAGYAFNGWYDGEGIVTNDATYVFNMPINNLEYVAKLTPNTNTPYKVIHYGKNYPEEGYTILDTDKLTGTTGTTTQAVIKEYDGFISPEMVQQEIIAGDGSTEVGIYYERNTYTVSLTSNVSSVTLQGGYKYKYGEEAVLKISNYDGYTFNGWYDGDILVSEEAEFTFSMPHQNLSYTAKLTINKYSITIDNKVEGLIISGVTTGSEYDYNTELTLTTSNAPSDYYITWKRSDNVSYTGTTYTFNVPSTNITITVVKTVYRRVENKIYYGSYPQTKVTDETLITKLNTKAGTLPTADEFGSWTSYGFYKKGAVVNDTFYQDIDYDKDGIYDYRGVYFTAYRDLDTANANSWDEPNQSTNGYYKNNTYWFSYDPIEWTILNEADGNVFIISNIIDSMDFCHIGKQNELFEHNGSIGRSNDYSLSDIRIWLNNNFYNTAFTSEQKTLIENTEVDNSTESTDSDTNPYFCYDTNDNIFLLSRKEVNTYFTTSSRISSGTDYAKSLGLYVRNNNSTWFTRSPHDDSKMVERYFYYVDGVQYSGDYYYSSSTTTSWGIRPACNIKL